MNALHQLKNESNNKISYSRGKTCQEQFNEAIQEIHESFDNGLLTCAAVGLLTGGSGVLPCSSVVTTIAIAQTAAAIDANTTCKQNQ